MNVHRALVLLKACKELLEKQDEDPFVLDVLAQKVFYDEAECDGQCLLEDIRSFLETECQTDC